MVVILQSPKDRITGKSVLARKVCNLSVLNSAEPTFGGDPKSPTGPKANIVDSAFSKAVPGGVITEIRTMAHSFFGSRIGKATGTSVPSYVQIGVKATLTAARTSATYEPFGDGSDTGVRLVLTFELSSSARPTADAPLSLGVEVLNAPVSPFAKRGGAKLLVTLSDANGKRPLQLLDTTSGLLESGVLLVQTGRISPDAGRFQLIVQSATGGFERPPRIRRLAINVLPIQQLETVQEQASGQGLADQQYNLGRDGLVFTKETDAVNVTTLEGGSAVSWTETNDLSLSRDDALPVEVKRRILQNAGKLLEWRGTRTGLLSLLQSVLGSDVKIEIIDLTVQHAPIRLGGCGGSSGVLPALLAGVPLRTPTLGEKAVLGRARLCGDINPLAAIVPTLRIRITAPQKMHNALQELLQRVVLQYIPAGITLVILWIAAEMVPQDVIGEGGIVLDDLHSGALGEDSAVGHSRIDGHDRGRIGEAGFDMGRLQ